LPELSQRIEGIENELKGLGGRAAT
jgi:hypothetical protein